MQTNTVQTLIDYVKDLSGQSNASTAKIIRALNFAVDHYSYLRITANGTWKWDSRNHSDLPRVTATLSGNKLSVENELVAIQHVEIYDNGLYHTVYPKDQRTEVEPLDNVYNGSGIPKYYDYDSRHLYFYPTADQSYTVRVTYSRAHPRFSTDNLTQSTGLEPIHEEYIALYAADRIMLGMSDSARVAVREELRIKEQEIKDLASKKDQDTPRRLKGKIPSTFMRK